MHYISFPFSLRHTYLFLAKIDDLGMVEYFDGATELKELTWKSLVLVIGTEAAFHVCPWFPDNDQMTFSAFDVLPAEYFISTFNVPMLAPYM